MLLSISPSQLAQSRRLRTERSIKLTIENENSCASSALIPPDYIMGFDQVFSVAINFSEIESFLEQFEEIKLEGLVRLSEEIQLEKSKPLLPFTLWHQLENARNDS